MPKQPSERDKASYFPENWRPLKESGQLELKPAEYEVVPGLTMETHARPQSFDAVLATCSGTVKRCSDSPISCRCARTCRLPG